MNYLLDTGNNSIYEKPYYFICCPGRFCRGQYSDIQSVTVDVPAGYKVVIVPQSATVPEAVSVAPAPVQTTYAAPAPVYHPRARHVASVAEGMVIEHQYDDHH